MRPLSPQMGGGGPRRGRRPGRPPARRGPKCAAARRASAGVAPEGTAHDSRSVPHPAEMRCEQDFRAHVERSRKESPGRRRPAVAARAAGVGSTREANAVTARPPGETGLRRAGVAPNPRKRGPRLAAPRGRSSAGRAPALQAGGRGFESHRLHGVFPGHRVAPRSPGPVGGRFARRVAGRHDAGHIRPERPQSDGDGQARDPRRSSNTRGVLTGIARGASVVAHRTTRRCLRTTVVSITRGG